MYNRSTSLIIAYTDRSQAEELERNAEANDFTGREAFYDSKEPPTTIRAMFDDDSIVRSEMIGATLQHVANNASMQQALQTYNAMINLVLQTSINEEINEVEAMDTVSVQNNDNALQHVAENHYYTINFPENHRLLINPLEDDTDSDFENLGVDSSYRRAM